MKVCGSCQGIHDSADARCPACGASPHRVDGFEAHAPEFAHEGGGFHASYFGQLAEMESTNFWFRARNRIIVWALRTYAPGFQSMLEVGCGTGFVLTGVAEQFPDARLAGSEIFVDGLPFAAKRLPSADLMQMDARNIPYVDEFDVVGAFDVLEHIAEDELVLDQIHKSLRPNGTMVIAVPQHQWLWGPADVYAQHERRYARRDLEQKVHAAGFHILRSTSFVSVLLPVMAWSRWRQRHSTAEFDPSAEFRINPLVNWAMEQLLAVERWGIRLGLNYPWGGSRLVVARKRP